MHMIPSCVPVLGHERCMFSHGLGDEKVVEGIRRRKGELEMLLEKSRSALAQLGS